MSEQPPLPSNKLNHLECPPELNGARILVVDDVAENRAILTQTLEAAGYSVSAAPSGEIALRIAERDVPDLILLDLLMPGINGFETCRRLKASDTTRNVPVIFITANNELESLLEGFEVGAVDFISKPIQTKEVLVRSETHLKLSFLTRSLMGKNRELTELNVRLQAEVALRRQSERNVSKLTEGAEEHFHVSGTLRHDAACYVEREADAELFEALMKAEFCYVLTSRQMGKSSLMARTAKRLRQNGVRVAALDLTAIGQNLTVEQWYDGLLSRIGERLDLEGELEDYWREHGKVNPVRRFFGALRDVVLVERPEPVAIFIDELDAVRSLEFETGEFFAAIRECFNRRSEDETLGRLTFCLLGVATPSDLVSNRHQTPFNIGRRIELGDLQPEQLTPLARGLGSDSDAAGRVMDRIFYWTSGHPYLTQRMCQMAVKRGAGSDADVDAIGDELFLLPRSSERDDNLIFVRERLIRSSVNWERLRDVFSKVQEAPESVLDDEDDPAMKELLLSGLITSVNGRLRVRNLIYSRVFSLAWWDSKLKAMSTL